MAENQPIESSGPTNSAAGETPQMAAVRAAREAFNARAPQGRVAPGASATSIEPARQEGPIQSVPDVQRGRSDSSGPSDAPVATTSAEQRIASRHSGDGLLAVGVLSELGGEKAYRVWATSDSQDLKSIADPQAREQAFETIVDNMRIPQYREALSLVDYGLEREAQRAFDARTGEGVASPETPRTLNENGAPPVAALEPGNLRELPKQSLPQSPAPEERSADVPGSPIEPPSTGLPAVSAAADPAIASTLAKTQAPPQGALDANSASAVEETTVGAVSAVQIEKPIEPVQAVVPPDQPVDVLRAATEPRATTAAVSVADPAVPVEPAAVATPQGVPQDAPKADAASAGEAVQENTIEAVPTPQRGKSLDELADTQKRLDEEDKASRRGPGARLLDALTSSLVGRERPNTGNEISSPAVMTKDGYGVPEAIASRYVVRDGDFWRFDEKDPGNADNHKPKFTDKGPRLATLGNDRGTAADMVTVAQAKGWQEVTLKGSEEFRRNAWMEATLAGMKTQGFEPKEPDRAMLEQARRERDALTITAGKRSPEVPRPVSTPTPKQTVESGLAAATVAAPAAATPVVATPGVATPGVAGPAEAVSPAAQTAQSAPAAPIPDVAAPVLASTAAPAAPAVASTPTEQAVSDRRVTPAQPGQNVLLEHGAAPYKNDKENAASYFVSYREPDGATKTVWGKDLERAVRDSGVKPGDALTLENLGSRPVTVDRPVKDAEGKTLRIDQIDTRLNVWDIQKQEKQSPGSQDPTATATNVSGLREQIEKALAGQPDNVVREVMDRLAERIQAGVAVQADQQKAGAPAQDLKPAIDTRLAQVDVDREVRQTVAEVAAPQRNPDRSVAKQSAPSVAR